MPRTLAVKLRPSAERIIMQGHPWIYSDSIVKVNPQGETGDLAIIFGHHSDKVIAIGLYDTNSAVRIKVIHHGGPQKIDREFFRQKIETAYQIRLPLLKTKTNAYRLIFGENDGFPGLIADIYDHTGVIKIYSSIWFPYVTMIAELTSEVANTTGVILRLSRHIRDANKTFQEGQVLTGMLESPLVEFEEYGIRFRTNVLLGHKTGFFLDHRSNRHKVGMLAKGKTVLDVFAYAGGFSVHALAGGAKEVISVDISKQVLKLADDNIKLNHVSGKHVAIVGDAFKCLKDLSSKHERFDIVVIDPPSFAKSEKEIKLAKKKYAELARAGVTLTKRSGLLVLASCSSRVTEEEFREIHKSVFRRLRVKYVLEHFTRHDVDHPVRFPEGAYLKTAYYRIMEEY